MKFYKDARFYYYIDKIVLKKLNCIYTSHVSQIIFYKNGLRHNDKNIAYNYNGYKEFYLNGKYYGNNVNFTKKSWRKFVKLQAFL